MAAGGRGDLTRSALAIGSGVLVHVAVGREAPSLISAVLAFAALTLATRSSSVVVGGALAGLSGLIACGATFAFAARGIELANGSSALGIAVVAAAAVVHALRFALAGALGAALGRRGVPSGIGLALGWFAAETLDPAPFPWSLAAAGLEVPQVSATADLGGAPLAALCVALIGGLLGEVLARRARRAWHMGATLTLGAMIVYGSLRTAQLRADLAIAPRVTVAAVHGVRRARDAARPPTRERVAADAAVAAGAKLVVLPEATLALPTQQAPEVAAQAVFGDLGAVVVVGVSTPPSGGSGGRNVLVALDAGGAVLGVQDKARPFPIGEDDTFPWGLAGLSAPAGTADRGRRAPPSTIARLGDRSAALVPSICWEDLFPEAAGLPREDGAALLLIVAANDGWFEGTPAGALHLLHARLRSVEARAPMARATNLGATAIVNPLGLVLAETRGASSHLVADVPLLDARPLAAGSGGSAAKAFAMAIALAGLVSALCDRELGVRAHRPTPSSTDRFP